MSIRYYSICVFSVTDPLAWGSNRTKVQVLGFPRDRPSNPLAIYSPTPFYSMKVENWSFEGLSNSTR
jgi:hypothetical protein